MTIGEFLKEKRNEKGLSLRQLAYKIKLSHTSISDIEKGVIKKESSILKIISALNLTNSEKEKALQLMVEELTPKDLQGDVLGLKKALIIKNNSNAGDIMVGNIKKVCTSIDEELKGLNDDEIQLVKNYITFLKSQKIIKK